MRRRRGRQGTGGDQGILALAEFGVVEVEGEREQIDRDGVGKGGLEIGGALLGVDNGSGGGHGLQWNAEGASGREEGNDCGAAASS